MSLICFFFNFLFFFLYAFNLDFKYKFSCASYKFISSQVLIAIMLLEPDGILRALRQGPFRIQEPEDQSPETSALLAPVSSSRRTRSHRSAVTIMYAHSVSAPLCIFGSDMFRAPAAAAPTHTTMHEYTRAQAHAHKSTACNTSP